MWSSQAVEVAWIGLEESIAVIQGESPLDDAVKRVWERLRQLDDEEEDDENE